MAYFTALFFGFFAAFFGLLAPSMLNMTAAKTSIENGRSAGIIFSLGAAIVVFAQGGIAVFFAKFFINNPQIVSKLKIAAIAVLLGLAVFFFLQARKNFRGSGKVSNKTPFLKGLGLSSLNMLAIPFYLTMVTLADSYGWIKLIEPYSYFFVFGAVLGSFSLFALYATFAILISKRIHFIAKNINYILSGLFVVLAITITLQLLI